MDHAGSARSLHEAAAVALAVAAWVGLRPLPVSAQVAEGVGAIVGRVVDAESGRPVVNAVVGVPARSIAVLSGEDGAFRLERVPYGTQLLRVRQFGYSERIQVVTVAGAGADLLIELEPAPVPVEGVDVSVHASMSLVGRVLDGVSGEPLSGVYVWLGTEGRGVFSDADGAFAFEEVPTGAALLQAEAVGYGRHYLPYYLSGSAAPARIELHADSAVLRGIPGLEDRLRGRRNASPGIVVALDRLELATRRADDARDFVAKYTLAQVVPCSGPARSHWCVSAGGRPVEAVVCIDGELALGGLDDLQRYRPHELYMVEVYGVRGMLVRAYTHGFVEHMARSRVDFLGMEPGARMEGVSGLGWETRGSEPALEQAPSRLSTRC